MEKRILIIMMAVALLGAVCAGSAFGRGPSNISATIHNLSTSGPSSLAAGPYLELIEDRICVYCHTPHGGELNTPLWNRDLTSFKARAYTHYNSATLSSEIKDQTTRAVSTESLLCLSCHDGSVGVGDGMINTSNGTPWNALAPIQPGFGDPGPRIGGSQANTTSNTDLTDDHPISFSYSNVQGLKPTEFVDVASVDPDLRFYGTGNRLECSTCHDPHVDYIANPEYDPFLAMPNTGSGMCLACHIK